MHEKFFGLILSMFFISSCSYGGASESIDETERIKVPDVVNLTVSDALSELRLTGIPRERIQIDWEETSLTKSKLDHLVCKQNPSANSNYLVGVTLSAFTDCDFAEREFDRPPNFDSVKCYTEVQELGDQGKRKFYSFLAIWGNEKEVFLCDDFNLNATKVEDLLDFEHRAIQKYLNRETLEGIENAKLLATLMEIYSYCSKRYYPSSFGEIELDNLTPNILAATLELCPMHPDANILRGALDSAPK
jgi:hypothetical protein